MVLMVFESVEILVALATYFAPVRLVLFHAQGAWIGGQSFGIDDRVGAVVVARQLLRGVTMLFFSTFSHVGRDGEGRIRKR